MNIIACNFRPIITHYVSNKSPILFRSNNLDDGTTQSAQWLRETMGIKSYFDLREESEFHVASKLDDDFIRRRAHEITPTQIHNDANSESCHRYCLGFIQLNCDWKNMTLADYYIRILDGSQEIIKKIFLLMTNVKCFPIVIVCRYGKDRTGVVAALVMDLIGCSEQQIIEEYSRSEELLVPLDLQLKEEAARLRISDKFARSRPEIMKKMLDYLKENYGSAEGYLKVCGLNDKEIKQIKTNLSA